jgi:putative ABC transport system permease protein
MIRNYIKIAIRNISRQKFYAIINITGLTIGLATSLLIVLYIVDEFSFDRFHTDINDMYRVDLKARLSEQYLEIAYTSAPIANAFVEEIPEIREACRIAFEYDINISYEDDAYTEKKVLLADSNFFDFFSFKLLHGDLREVLRQPNSIVLTEKSANKLFGYPTKTKTPPLGKIVKYGTEGRACIITGIAEDTPHNSHFQYNMILSMESWGLSKMPDWTNNILLNYVKLDDRADWKQVEAKFPGMVRKNIAPLVKAYMGIEFDDFLKNGGMYEYVLEPVKRIHLYSTVDDTIEQRGSINTIYILSAIVLFILIIACINFMNLSTARFSDRAKEVGVRKSLGASRARLIMQFLNESMLFTLISMLLAVLILYLVLPLFNSISGKFLTISTLLSWEYFLALIFIVILVGFLAGSYPSIYLTSFKPTEVLRGKVKAGLKSGGVRSGLVVFQFSISIILIISTLLIYKQLNLLESRDLGFEKENVLLLRNIDALGKNKNSFKEEIKKISGIVNVSISSAAPPHIIYSSIFEPMDGTGNELGMNYCFSDHDFLKTMNMQIVSGRYFSKDIPSDSNAVIINESAARKMGWDDAIGEKIDAKWNPATRDLKEIIGIVKDFNFQTLRKEISPLIIFPGSEGNLMLVSMSPNDYSNKISEIEQVWNTLNGNATFDYSFIDTEFDALYRKDQQLGRIIFIFTALAIIVACLGLLGLATFTAEQRSKEIGIRKSLGASSTGIVGMLSLEYLKLIGFAFLIAIPVSYAIISWWLNNFAFKINIGVVSFMVGGLLAVIIALLSVSFQSVKAANSNPVDSLKYE